MRKALVSTGTLLSALLLTLARGYGAEVSTVRIQWPSEKMPPGQIGRCLAVDSKENCFLCVHYRDFSIVWKIDSDGKATAYAAMKPDGSMESRPGSNVALVGRRVEAIRESVGVSVVEKRLDRGYGITDKLAELKPLRPAPQVEFMAVDSADRLLLSNLGIAVDSDGRIYLMDSNWQQPATLMKVTPSGDMTVVSQNKHSNADGTDTYKRPGGLAVDKAGNIVIADSGDATIKRCAPDGTVTHVAGYSRLMGWTDSPAKMTGNKATDSALFSEPRSLAIGNDGTIYVADASVEALRAIRTNGNVVTIAGLRGTAYQKFLSGHADGPTDSALLGKVLAVAVAQSGTIYFLDAGTDQEPWTLRKITSSR